MLAALLNHSFFFILCHSTAGSGMDLRTWGSLRWQASCAIQTCCSLASRVEGECKSCHSPVPPTQREFLQPLCHLAEFKCFPFYMLVALLSCSFLSVPKDRGIGLQSLRTVPPTAVHSIKDGYSLCYYVSISYNSLWPFYLLLYRSCSVSS